MNTTTPPLPPAVRKARLSWPIIVLIVSAIIPGLLLADLIGLRICGLIRPFSVPTGPMEPTISRGDHVMMEGFTYLRRKPRRGDIIVFKTDGIKSLPPKTMYVKRIAGDPGEHLRISDGKLYVNDVQVIMTNVAGEIVYSMPEQFQSMALHTDLVIPRDQYFVLGDNSTNSLDSRFWGCVPAGNVLGKIWFRYEPSGGIKRVE